MQKATREAKQQTSWTENNSVFEDALNSLLSGMLRSDEFIADLTAFVDRISHAGQINSLAQTLLKNIGPGVPDLYQGSELWDFSLVDPDNRRPVDYTLRRNRLADLMRLEFADVFARFDEGLPKLWTIVVSLRLRREHPDWFRAEAGYRPLTVDGSQASHCIAFARGEHVVAIVPRAPLTLANDWADTTVHLPEGEWHNHLTDDSVTGGAIPLAKLLSNFPVALLVKETPIHA